MRSCSIRTRLTLWYGLALAVVLAGAGTFWYLYLASNLRQQIDERLLLIAQDITVYHAVPHPGEDAGTHGRQLDDFLHRHARGEYVQILDARGSICCLSDNLHDARLPLSKEALQQTSRGIPWYETRDIPGGGTIRLLSYPVFEKGQLALLIQVGGSLDNLERTLRGLLLILLIFSPLAVAAMVFGGWFLGRQAMAPFDRMIREARHIDAENLSRRLSERPTDDEISLLAETFNSMLDRLQASFTKIRQFTGDASHELRTPLAILRGETEVALRWAKSSEEYRQTLESNLEEIDRMGRIIEDLLTISKSEAGEAPLVLETFSLGDLLQDLYLQGKTLAEPKGIALSLRLQVQEDVQLRGDKLRLHQMLLNLVANAVKYTNEGGRVETSLAVRGGEAIIAVSDNGMGIAPEHIPLIFDRFYRVDEARNRNAGGTGLGLAIVKWIVDAHRGRIEVASTVGEGSVFSVHLPLAGPPERDKKGSDDEDH